ncbi:MAG: hypothetical protein HKM28_02395 [Flavobacteriaceae bacterium]|nr:hypothetical protein [Flavobacteriaceae bacterium]
MEANNFEEEVREKLQEREMAVSENAWSQLDARLVATRNSKDRSFPWLAIAASIIGVLLVTSVWWTSQEEISPAIVSEEIKAPIQEENETKNDDLIEDIAPAIVEQDSEVKLNSLTKMADVSASKTVSKVNPTSIPQEPKHEMISSVKEKQMVANTQTRNDLEPELIASKLVATETSITEQDVLNINEEVEKLLEETENSIKSPLQKERSIDAAALLSDVEDDLEESFRNKVFDAIGIGVEKIHTAVVERNN